MAPKPPCAKYQYVVTSAGPKILPVDEPSCKDEESPADYNAGGYLPVKVNDTFKQGRYRIVRKLGWGHFSTVWLVKDTHTSVHSALKVVKSAGRYAETARDEIKLLSRVASVSPTHPGRAHIVSFLDSFAHQGPESSHICIVFEPLGENLLALIERNKKKGVPRALVKVIAKQILLGLEYLHDECDLVHTDIKPENILISIPDIEAHIQHELTQSPSPTSRRVGVPLPTKSRAGMTIPYNQQRSSRRQVQIFDSQPLSSPGRSVGRSAAGHSSAIATSARPLDSGSGSNSLRNSYVTQMNLLRHSSSGAGLPTYASFIGGSASAGSSIPKVPSNLSASFPVPQPKIVPASGNAPSQPPPPPANGPFKSPSTSSSSSSISSALASATAASSSLISTPPTSLSQSLISAAAGFVNSSTMPIDLKSRPAFFDGLEQARQGLPIQENKKDLEVEVTSASASDSYKMNAPVSASWTDKLSSSLSSSYKSKSSPLKSSKPRSSNPHAHSRSQSGIPGAHWQDPGTAAPAPAVLVNAVVGADGQESMLRLADINDVNNSTSSIAISQSTSENSSATATAAQPSPTGTPMYGSRKGKTMSIINGVSKLISDTSNIISSGLQAAEKVPTNATDSTTSSNHHVSLLTQTAPRRISAAPSSPLERTNVPRASPPQQISQLSAHMHAHQPSSSCSFSPAFDPCSLRHHIDNRNIQPTSDNPRLASTTVPSSTTPRSPPMDSPSAPPPTPIDGPTLGSLFPAIDVHGTPLAPLETSNPATPPPISIKIADLGNATPSNKHYTEDIQTRQYRSPEAIVGRRDWDARADVWSVACVVFELLTSEYLFDPQGQGELFTKDDDHMAQIIELLGDFPLEVKMGGKYSRELFDHTGALRYIRTLKPWPLRRVMVEKYLYSEEDATALCSFLEPMLTINIRERVHAHDIVDHVWLKLSSEEEVIEW